MFWKLKVGEKRGRGTTRNTRNIDITKMQAKKMFHEVNRNKKDRKLVKYHLLYKR